MNKLNLLILSSLLLLSACKQDPSPAQNTSPTPKNTAKGKLFIIGGGGRPDMLVSRMLAEAGVDSTTYVAILPMASETPDSSFMFASEQFLERKIKVLDCNFKKGEVLSPSKLDSLRNAKLIYVPGGDQNKFMAIMEGTQAQKILLEAFQNGAMVAGTSAGAAMMSQDMITGNQLKESEYAETFSEIKEKNVEIGKGMGLLKNAIIDQHFIVRSRYNRLISVAIEYPEQKAIGIDEATAILVKGDSAEVVGTAQVIVIENPKKSKTVLNAKLGANDLLLHIYLNGQKFAL